MKSGRVRLHQTALSGPAPTVRGGYIGSLVLLLMLVLWCMVWESVAAPLRPGGTWLILKGLPLLFWVPGLLRQRIRSLQALSLVVLAYALEGLTRLFSDLPATRWAAGVASLNAVALWVVCLYTIRITRRRQSPDTAAAHPRPASEIRP